jgi:hypothetical protein
MGTFSLGFKITQFPHVNAIGIVHIGTMIGKLKGTIEATIPNGSLLS